jgi:hypothetical protein
MSFEHDFGSRVDRELSRREQAMGRERQAELDLQQAQEAAEASRQEQARQDAENVKRAEEIYAKRIAAIPQRDPKLGTAPDTVWGTRVGALCTDFVKFMEGNDFEGATTLKHKALFGRWAIRGFGVGGISFDGPAVGLSPATPLPHNVFLCEDDRLRLWVNDSARSSRRQGHNNRSQPSQIFDLPLSPQGEIVVPRTGNFYKKVITQMVAKTEYRLEANNPKFGGQSKVSYKVSVPHEHHVIDFKHRNIDDILIEYAANAAQGISIQGEQPPLFGHQCK